MKDRVIDYTLSYASVGALCFIDSDFIKFIVPAKVETPTFGIIFGDNKLLSYVDIGR
jgi:hypothetical protein